MRHGERIDVDAVPEEQGGQGFLGIAPAAGSRNVSLVAAPFEGVRALGTTTAEFGKGIGHLVSPAGVKQYSENFTDPAKEGSRRDLERPRSLVGITDIGSKYIAGSVWALLFLLGSVSLVLAIVNLLPLLPFDGGHAAVVIYEAIASRIKGRTVRVDFRKLMPITAVVLALFVMLGLSAMALDIRDIADSPTLAREPTRRLGSIVAMERRATRQVVVGNVAVGGGAPISVQSMTTTKTADVDGTLAQIYALAAAGCRHRAVHVQRGSRGRGARAHRGPLAGADRRRHPLPVQARARRDRSRRAGAAAQPRQHPQARAHQARRRARRGPRAADPHRCERGVAGPRALRAFGGATPEALVASAIRELDYFREVDFDDVKISVKASNVPLMIDAYRLLADTVDYPLHLGVTEAGPPPAGLVKSTAGIGTLLSEGIGDTIRFSLTADPVEEARRAHVARGAGFARAQGRRPDRVSELRSRGSRRDRGRDGSAARARGSQHPVAGRGDGLRRERAR